MTNLRAVEPPTMDEDRRQAYEIASERRKRIDALKVDRSKVPHEKHLPQTPPEALRAEERIKRLRAGIQATRFELLQAWWSRAKRAGEIPREPIPVKK